MGRKPNPLILEYFVRGPKLADNSNRYPHTCKQCGETFPKGRIDSLTSHITKKCPAIPEADRMRACLELHGLAVAKAAAADRSLHADKRAKPREANGDGSVPTSGPGSQSWLGLETLAEASRQVEVVRQVDGDGRHEDSPATPDDSHSLELHQHFTLDDPPVAFDGMQQDDGQRGMAFQFLPRFQQADKNHSRSLPSGPVQAHSRRENTSLPPGWGHVSGCLESIRCRGRHGPSQPIPPRSPVSPRRHADPGNARSSSIYGDAARADDYPERTGCRSTLGRDDIHGHGATSTAPCRDAPTNTTQPRRRKNGHRRLLERTIS